jgi:hypothetical protein
MSSEPPGSDHGQEEGSGNESPGSHVAKRSRDGGRVRWRSSIVPIVGVLAVAGGIGVFLFLTQQSEPKPEHVSPALGLTCPSLQQAADAFDRGDRVTYSQAVDQAANVAEDTLQKSGEVFGQPERIALELRLGPQERIPELLGQAEKLCSRLGQWTAANN